MRETQGIVMIMGSWGVETETRLPSQIGEQCG
jgi:hypothetical protein